VTAAGGESESIFATRHPATSVWTGAPTAERLLDHRRVGEFVVSHGPPADVVPFTQSGVTTVPGVTAVPGLEGAGTTTVVPG